MKVAQGNESMATAEMMAVVESLNAMVERFKQVREDQFQEVHDFIRQHDLWHLEADSLLEGSTHWTVMDEHKDWLASNHDC